MMGLGSYAWAMERIGGGMVRLNKRVDAMITEYPNMPREEAYIRVSCEMQHEAWQAAEDAKLKDIREHGT